MTRSGIATAMTEKIYAAYKAAVDRGPHRHIGKDGRDAVG
jgi:hypothetical protein